MKNKYPFPLCGSFLCTWILSSTYLICLSSFLGLILVFSANFCLKAVLQSPITPSRLPLIEPALHGIETWTHSSIWASTSGRITLHFSVSRNHLAYFPVHMTVESACVSQWSQSFIAELLPNNFFLILRSTLFLLQFSPILFRKASYYTKMMLFVRILLNSKHCTAYWQPHSAWNCLPINNILLISLSRLFMNLLARPRADPWGPYQNICCHFFTLNYW